MSEDIDVLEELGIPNVPKGLCLDVWQAAAAAKIRLYKRFFTP